jgi:hypothetical protein
MPAETRRFDQVRGKSEWWTNNHEVHSSKVGEPFVGGDKFVAQFDIDVTDKASKKRMQMSEVEPTPSKTARSRARNSCLWQENSSDSRAEKIDFGSHTPFDVG